MTPAKTRHEVCVSKLRAPYCLSSAYLRDTGESKLEIIQTHASSLCNKSLKRDPPICGCYSLPHFHLGLYCILILTPPGLRSVSVGGGGDFINPEYNIALLLPKHGSLVVTQSNYDGK